jgi:hypothetical protein
VDGGWGAAGCWNDCRDGVAPLGAGGVPGAGGDEFGSFIERALELGLGLLGPAIDGEPERSARSGVLGAVRSLPIAVCGFAERAGLDRVFRFDGPDLRESVTASSRGATGRLLDVPVARLGAARPSVRVPVRAAEVLGVVRLLAL